MLIVNVCNENNVAVKMKIVMCVLMCVLYNVNSMCVCEKAALMAVIIS